MSQVDIFSTTSRVEVPFIRVTIAGTTFGVYNTKIEPSAAHNKVLDVVYPNYIQSLTVDKNASGKVNKYTLELVYAIQPGDDPNMIEKLLSKAKSNRQIYFSYGDSEQFDHAYKEESAIFVSYTFKINASSGTIVYTIYAVSNTVSQIQTKFSFPGYSKKKPSELIKQLLFSSKYGLQTIFTGMTSREIIDNNHLISDDDIAIELEAKSNISVLDYIQYLVSCMKYINENSTSDIKSNIYRFAIYDTVFVDENYSIYSSSKLSGTYFRIIRIGSQGVIDEDSLKYANIDIGFPGQGNVISFDVSSNEGFSILYDYSGDLQQNTIQYLIGNDGKTTYQRVNSSLLKTTGAPIRENDKTWWTNMTSYPISATLEVRGLLRNIELLSMIKLDVVFFGNKHICSGIYLVNKVVDRVSSSGFTTKLSLIRVRGESL